MEKHTLKSEPRTQVGRKVKSLRKAGLVPGTVYGKKVHSTSIAVDATAFGNVYEKAGESALVELTLDGSVRPVLIHNVQRDAVTGNVLHVEFFQVDLKEKVKTKVPLEFTGDSGAVAQKLGVLLTIIDEVEVEALPKELPEHITVDVTGLKALGEEFKVSDIKPPTGVTILTDSALTVVKIGPLVTKEAEAEAAAEAAEAASLAAASEAGATVEGAPVAEAGEAKPTEEAPVKPPEPKKE